MNLILYSVVSNLTHPVSRLNTGICPIHTTLLYYILAIVTSAHYIQNFRSFLYQPLKVTFILNRAYLPTKSLRLENQFI